MVNVLAYILLEAAYCSLHVVVFVVAYFFLLQYLQIQSTILGTDVEEANFKFLQEILMECQEYYHAPSGIIQKLELPKFV